MPMSAYLKRLRDAIGSELLMLPGVAAVVRDASGRARRQLHLAIDDN
jgi:hypothetical protein